MQREAGVSSMELLKENVMNEHYRLIGELEAKYMEMVNNLMKQKAMIQQNMMRTLHQKLLEIQQIIDAQRLNQRASQSAAETTVNPLLAAFPSMLMSAVEGGTVNPLPAPSGTAFIVDSSNMSSSTTSRGSTLSQCTPSSTLGNVPILGQSAFAEHSRCGQSGSGPFQCKICGSTLQSKDALDFHLTMHSLTDGLLNHDVEQSQSGHSNLNRLNVLIHHNLNESNPQNQANRSMKELDLPPMVIAHPPSPWPLTAKIESVQPLVLPLCTENTATTVPAAECDTKSGFSPNRSARGEAADVPVEDDVAENLSPKTPKTKIVDKSKPFQCPQCQRRFKQRRELNRHFINRHTPNAAKPFKCRFCSYGAATKSIVQRHEYTHSATKPYKCSLCKYQTSYRYILKKHLFKVHAVTDHEADAVIEADTAGPAPADRQSTASPMARGTPPTTASPGVAGQGQDGSKRQWHCAFCDKVCGDALRFTLTLSLSLCLTVYITPFPDRRFNVHFGLCFVVTLWITAILSSEPHETARADP